jgi:hypothetical protein
MNKKPFKIFFYHQKDGTLANALVEEPSMNGVWQKYCIKDGTYKDWICIKCCTTGVYAWRNGVANDDVIQRELAMQRLVESNLTS